MHSALLLEEIPSGRVPHEWEWIGPLLQAAFSIGQTDPMTVFSELVKGQSQAWIVRTPDAIGVAITAIDGEKTCWLRFIAGHIDGQPKQFIKTINALMGEFERKARLAECVQMAVAGRDWSRVLTGYEIIGNDRNELRKVL